ncbi:hypothetical protein PMAYCL1PPCAC_08785, partial [Pristionchus mayeri]
TRVRDSSARRLVRQISCLNHRLIVRVIIDMWEYGSYGGGQEPDISGYKHFQTVKSPGFHTGGEVAQPRTLIIRTHISSCSRCTSMLHD